MMTLALLDFPYQTPTARDLMARALEPHLLIGMPHLTPSGLSETWLMKELGHRHWLMLARHLGMDDADFRTPDGNAAYAAICATSLRNAQLGLVSANDVLTIRSTLSVVSRTQMSSTHRLLVGATPIAEVELLSTFVHRLHAGDNNSIARIAPSNPSPTLLTDNALAKSTSDMRRAIRGASSDVTSRLPIGRFRFRTSPSQEFNGAGLFYFAEFQALMDRAYEQQCRVPASPRPISDRDVFFFGNVQETEIVTVEIHQARANPLSSDVRLYRGDGKIIACAQCSRQDGQGRS